MSSKSTIIFTSDNDHWYTDCNGQYCQGSKNDDPLVLEISPVHKIETTEYGTVVLIEKGTELYTQLMEFFSRNN
jgi:hypothetical protein